MDLPIKNCRKCHILSEQTGSLLCEAKVSSIKDDEIHLVFSGWKPVLDSIYRQPVVFYDSVNGLVKCSCTICEIRPLIEKSGFFHATCQIEAVEDLTDRHEDFRMKLSLSVTIGYDDPGTGRARETVGLTDNISAGGVYLITARKLPTSNIIIRFHKDVLPVNLHAQILREEDLDTGKFGYGCRFVNLSAYAESLLRGYIFQMEIIHRKKG